MVSRLINTGVWYFHKGDGYANERKIRFGLLISIEAAKISIKKTWFTNASEMHIDVIMKGSRRAHSGNICCFICDASFYIPFNPATPRATHLPSRTFD